MTTQKYNKPVIVLDVGKVLVDYDPTVVAKGLSKRCGREVGLPQADDLYRLFFRYMWARSHGGMYSKQSIGRLVFLLSLRNGSSSRVVSLPAR